MELSLVFPHQLFEHHPALRPGRGVVLIEDPLLFGSDPQWPIQVHRQRLLLHRASMNAYAETLQARGFTVLRVLQGQSASTTEILGGLLDQGYRSFHLADPVDDVLTRRISSFASHHGCGLEILSTPMLLTPAAVIDNHFASGKKPLMGRFYEMQRKRLDLLIEPDGGPVGGRWSFDADNRKKLPKGILVPEPPAERSSVSTAHVETARQQLIQEGVAGIGNWDDFHYPVTHGDAARWLDQFLEQRLRSSGLTKMRSAPSTG